MPLTMSHPAAVIPLRRLGLPMTGLVVGSMVPDGPVFLGAWRLYGLTHSLPGIVTVDAALTVVAVAVWVFVLRDPMVDLAPQAVRSRLLPRHRLTGRAWLLTPIAGAVGAATHVAWDTFTHAHRWGTEHVGWLARDAYGLPVHQWVQYGSTAAGLAIVAVAAWAHLRAVPPVHARARTAHPVLLPVCVGGCLLVAWAGVATREPAGLYGLVFHTVVDSISALVAGIALAAVAWHLVALRLRLSTR